MLQLFPPEPRSLFGEILDWMLVPLLLLWPMSLVLTYAAAENIANQPYDRELGEMARAIARQIVFERSRPDTPSRVRLRQQEIAADMLRADDTDHIYFRVLGARGEHVAGDGELTVPDDAPVPQELRFRNDEIHGEPVRIAYLWVAGADARIDTPALVQVAETLGRRSHLAAEIVKGVIFPQF
ncbi:MAG TPA: sensor histidine kinase N-terminal domain-containing protein, partial [Burkholderiaceae bacterium]|nr:sensor histidine kinase N-terminal domain-containing protein [Burkholderiaceae bacterium]